MKFCTPATLFVTLLIITSCCTSKQKVDMVIYNAVVYTVDSTFSVQEAIAVDKGKFVAVGSSRNILKRFDGKQKIDADGKAIFPGFMDGHCHFSGLGEYIVRYTDLTGCRSFDEIIMLLQKHAEEFESEWLLGMGWDQNLWEGEAFPTNGLLSMAFPGKKIALTRIDGHAGLVSEEVLKTANLNATSQIEGGTVILDNLGKPTGLLLDNAYDKVRTIIPPLTPKEKAEALLRAQQRCFEVGLSGVTDAGLDIETILLIDSLQQKNLLKININAMINSDRKTTDYFFSKGVIDKEKLSVRAVKLYADGALGSRGAKLLKPYNDAPETSGLMIAEDTFYVSSCKRAYQAGYQVCTHAIGDAAVRKMLHIYAAVLKGKNDLRWRIEHSQVVNPEDFAYFADYSVIPSIQSTHATSDMYWAEKRIGTERLKNAYAQHKLLEQNHWLINGTDFPIENTNPLYTFYAAVVRKDLQGRPEGGFQPENALSREQALRSITCWVAKGCFAEHRKGSIEAGKDADFVMLSDDIMQVAESSIPLITVLRLYISGEKAYQKQNVQPLKKK